MIWSQRALALSVGAARITMSPMWRNALILLGLTLLSAAVFAQTRQFEFVNYDDPGHVGARPELRAGLSWPGVRWVFTTTFVANYIPVTGLTFLADYSMHGLDPGGYHITNVVLHTEGEHLVLKGTIVVAHTDDEGEDAGFDAATARRIADELDGASAEKSASVSRGIA